MVITRSKLYILLLITCAAGYGWVIWLFRHIPVQTGTLCLFKHVTTLPCPSCGSTRSVMAIISGNLSDALYWNPFGVILALAMVVVPLWIICDLLYRGDSFYRFYLRAEHFFRRRVIAIPAILLVIVNWIWNLYKNA